MQEWYHRWATSLGDFEETPEKAWGTEKYDPEKHIDEKVVFCGLYGLPDFYALWRHKGRKSIFWCGSDISHFINGYWLDDEGHIKINPEQLARWIEENCDSYVENQREADVLRKFGISSKIVPSFFGLIRNYPLSYQYSDRPKVYASVSGDDFDRYCWNDIDRLASENPDIDFYLYGNSVPWNSPNDNVFVRGRVSKEQMNEEIKNMQGALRPLYFDGFSEVLAKSVLWGQWPISRIPYPHMLSIEEIGTLKDKKEPNIEGRKYYKKNINKYPWKAQK